MFVSPLPIAKTQVTTTKIKKGGGQNIDHWWGQVRQKATANQLDQVHEAMKHRRWPALMKKAIGCSYHSVDLGFIPIEGTQPGYPTPTAWNKKAVNTRIAKSLTYTEAGGAARLGPRCRGGGGGGLDPGHCACGVVGHWIGFGARRRGGCGGSTGAERSVLCSGLGTRPTFSCLVPIRTPFLRLILPYVSCKFLSFVDSVSSNFLFDKLWWTDASSKMSD